MKKINSQENITEIKEFQLGILRQVSQVAIAPFDFNRVLDAMMERVIEMMHTDAGSIILQNEDTGFLEFKVTKGVQWIYIRSSQ